MPMYRVKFKGDEEDQLIEADGVQESGTSYRLYREEDAGTVAQIPRDAVLSIVEEKADAG